MRIFGKKIDEIEETSQAGPARSRAIGVLYARSGLFQRAREAFRTAIFGDSAAGSLERALDVVPEREDVLHVLLDLGICLTLGARSPRDLALATRCLEKGLERLPGESRLRAEYLLRLALVHRLRGDLSAEKATAEAAFEDAPLLREEYGRMIQGTGARAGENDDARRFLVEGIR